MWQQLAASTLGLICVGVISPGHSGRRGLGTRVSPGHALEQLAVLLDDPGHLGLELRTLPASLDLLGNDSLTVSFRLVSSTRASASASAARSSGSRTVMVFVTVRPNTPPLWSTAGSAAAAPTLHHQRGRAVVSGSFSVCSASSETLEADTVLPIWLPGPVAMTIRSRPPAFAARSAPSAKDTTAWNSAA
jgi:hypothetical protein